MTRPVSIVECPDYNQERIDVAVSEALLKIRFSVKKGSKVLIKPNILGQNTPEQHSGTHFSIIDSLCRYFNQRGCEVTIGESSAFYQKGYTKGSAKTSKILDVAHKNRVPFMAFDEDEIEKVPKSNLKFLKELYLPKSINNYDLIVDVPKLKSHMLMRFTGAVKNLYGIIPGGYKQLFHTKVKNINQMAEIFLDILSSIKPKILCVMDAVVGLDGGPAAVIGRPKQLGYILASTDPTAMDVIACQMIGYSPEDIPTLTMARKRHLIRSFKDVKVIGQFKKVQFKNLQKGPITDSEKPSILVTETHAWPCINSECIHCNACIKYCPLKALSEVNGKVVVDKSKCIFCYTCVPKCPVSAIKLCSSPMGNFIQVIRRIIRL